jgi:hypothetical protein
LLTNCNGFFILPKCWNLEFKVSKFEYILLGRSKFTVDEFAWLDEGTSSGSQLCLDKKAGCLEGTSKGTEVQAGSIENE